MNNINEYISSLNTADLLQIKALVETKIQDHYDDKDNFYLHERIDDYTYIIDFVDGTRHYDYIGARAYKKYITDKRAVALRRRTKDLFPTYENLLVKEEYKA